MRGILILILLTAVIELIGCQKNTNSSPASAISSSATSLGQTSDLQNRLNALPLPEMDPAILQRSNDDILAWLFKVSQWKMDVMNMPDRTFEEKDEKLVEQELGKLISNPKIISELVRTFYIYDAAAHTYSKKEINDSRLQPGWNEYKIELKKLSESQYSIIVMAKKEIAGKGEYLSNHTQLDISKNGMTFMDFTDIHSDQDPDYWPHQIVEDNEVLPTINTRIKTIWSGTLDGINYTVYTGSDPADAKQGIAIIHEMKEGQEVQFFDVKSPQREGFLRAVTDDGERVILQSEEGTLYTLNVQTHRFENNNSQDLKNIAKLPITMMLEKDLNGDGMSEKLEMTGMGNVDQPFIFTVNGKPQQPIVTNDPIQELQGTFEVVDLNTSLKGKQIAFPERGPSGMAATAYFRYDAGTGDITWIGTVPGSGNALRYLGNGQIITSKQRATVLSTWFHEQTYEWTKQNKMEPVQEDLYKTNIPVTLKKPLPLYVSRTNDHLAGTMKAGEKAVIEQSDDLKWFFIRGDGGVSGWFAVRDFSFVINADSDANELFDGLNNAA
jgi:hypothetical protein